MFFVASDLVVADVVGRALLGPLDHRPHRTPVRCLDRGERGAPPATITALSGDIHFGYVAGVDLGGRSRVCQVVSSPFRQSTEAFERHAQRLSTTPHARPDFDWSTTGPWSDDHLVVLTVAGRPAGARRVRRGRPRRRWHADAATGRRAGALSRADRRGGP